MQIKISVDNIIEEKYESVVIPRVEETVIINNKGFKIKSLFQNANNSYISYFEEPSSFLPKYP